MFDLFIIGGGINGAGIARDAAGRGLGVALCEQGDFAGATSSASTKLIHGGLRYLEQYEFRLVAEALSEREVLLGIAPHIARPLSFVMPHVPELRPAWMIRAGLFLYDHIGKFGGAFGKTRNTLPQSHGVDLRATPYGSGLKPEFKKGFVYSDAWVDDARLVILNLRSARDHGATILPRTRFTHAKRENGGWTITLEDSTTTLKSTVRARMLVNAAGPWVKHLFNDIAIKHEKADVQLDKGSHIIVPRLFEGEHAYILQNADRRIIFMIPYEHDFTLIGTTDVRVGPTDYTAEISPAEIEYLCAAANRYSNRPITPADVVHSYSGVRPLFDDGSKNPSETTRDYTLVLDADNSAPLLSVFGGKLTTYRRLAEAVLDHLKPWSGTKCGNWTGDERLPGGSFSDHAAYFTTLKKDYPNLPEQLLQTMMRRHGSLTPDILGDAQSVADLGPDFGGGLTETEALYLIAAEWTAAPDDILWRRTKCGLHMTSEQREAFALWYWNHI